MAICIAFLQQWTSDVKRRHNCDVWKYFFSCRIVDVWNSLSEAIVKSSSVNSLKTICVMLILVNF